MFVLKMVSQEPNVKLSPKFEGPYRVEEVLKLNKYRVIDKECKEIIVHYNNLKVVKGDTNWNYPLHDKSSEDESPTSSDSEEKRYNLHPR